MSAKEILTPLFEYTLPETDYFDKYRSRLEYEFGLIDKNKFCDVFIQVKKIIELCEEYNIPHIIRGSAGSSLVCYMMKISHTDPILYGMDVCRFMNHWRTDIPDIDIDVPYNRRDELYELIAKTWPKMVARISNHVKYQYKSALQKALKIFAPHIKYKKGSSIEDLTKEPELIIMVNNYIKVINGTLRTESLHCGGIVIFEKEKSVPSHLILKDDPDATLPQIKLDKDETEDAGFIKIDILSNRGLAQFTDASSTDLHSLNNKYSLNKKVYELFETGNTIGITFAESRGMRHIFKQLKPKSIEDISIALGLIRPAAASDGRKMKFLQSYKTHKTTSKIDDLIRPIVFDDDALARIKACLSVSKKDFKWIDGTSDFVRKAFAKQKKEDIQSFRKFCLKYNYSKTFIDELFDDLDQLQHYSFCKSHALSYAYLVYGLAYQKIHNPLQFWVSTLNHCHSMYKKWVHFREAISDGAILTRGYAPFKLVDSIIVSKKGIQKVLLPDNHKYQIYSDILTYGYWLTKDFLPNCYLSVQLNEKPKNEKQKYIISFCGLVATGRVVYSSFDGGSENESMGFTHKKAITFLCVGYDNKKYIDVIVHGARNYLLGFPIVKGTCFSETDDLSNIELFECNKIQKVTYKSLLEIV